MFNQLNNKSGGNVSEFVPPKYADYIAEFSTNSNAVYSAKNSNSELSRSLAVKFPISHEFLRSKWDMIISDFVNTSSIEITNENRAEFLLYGWVRESKLISSDSCLKDIIKFETRLQQFLHDYERILKWNNRSVGAPTSFCNNFLLSRYDYPVDKIYSRFYSEKHAIDSNLNARKELLQELIKTPKKPIDMLMVKNADEKLNKNYINFVVIGPAMKRFIRLLQQHGLPSSIRRIVRQYPAFDVNAAVEYLVSKRVIKV